MSMKPLWTFNWEEQIHEPSVPRLEGFYIKCSHKCMVWCVVSGAQKDCMCSSMLTCYYIADIFLLVNVINSKLIECILTAAVMLLYFSKSIHMLVAVETIKAMGK